MIHNKSHMTIINNNKLHILLEIMPIQILFFIFWTLAIVSTYTDKSNVLAVVIGSLIVIGSFLYSIIYIFFFQKYSFDLKTFWNKNKYLFPIFLIFIICACTTWDSWLNLDGFQYYQEIRRIRNFDFIHINNLMLCGHMSQGYSIFMLIGEFLTPGNVIGARIVQCIMGIITIYCFYSVADTVLVCSDGIDKALYTALFAFSPLLLCTISDLNLDFPLVCFFTWMICCGIKQKYILQSFCGILLCFSKETGCILYGFYLIGLFIYRTISVIKSRKKMSVDILKKIFTLDLWIAMLGGILWIITFISSENKGWMKNTEISAEQIGIHLNSIAIYPAYIIQRLRQIFYINFAWIFFYIILLFACFIIFRICKNFFEKINIKSEILFGIILSFLGFLAYSCLYVTWDHYRYLIPLAFFLFFGTMIAMECIHKNLRIKKLVLCFLAGILFCSNFYTFDPISEMFFWTENTGVGNILIYSGIGVDENKIVNVNKSDTRYTSATINNSSCNFQVVHMYRCFNISLKQLCYDDNTLIILPCEYRNAFGTTATLFGINVKGYSEYYWDKRTEQLNINCADEIEKMKNDSRYCKFNYRVLNSLDELSQEEMGAYQHIYYMALPFQKDFDHAKFLESADSKYIDTVQYISWKWDIYQIK